MTLEQGLSASFDYSVREEDLSIALTSGDVPVLSTPRVIAWCEAATMAAIEGHISEQETTVGMRVRVDHVNPSGLGAMIRVSALLTRIDGRRVSAHDEHSQIAMGQVIRVIVHRQRFLERV